MKSVVLVMQKKFGGIVPQTRALSNTARYRPSSGIA